VICSRRQISVFPMECSFAGAIFVSHFHIYFNTK